MVVFSVETGVIRSVFEGMAETGRSFPEVRGSRNRSEQACVIGPPVPGTGADSQRCFGGAGCDARGWERGGYNV